MNGSNVPVFSQARSTRQANYGLAADYDLNRTSSLNGSVEREDYFRNFRERDKTWENKIKLGYVNRALGETTLRVSFENDTKRGSAYRYRTFEDLGTGLPGLGVATQAAIEGTGVVTVNGITYPALNANLFSRYSSFFRKYDQADRNQNILNTRVNVMAMEDLDVGVNMQVKRVNYTDSFYGLKKDNQNSIGFDMNYQPSVSSIITAYYNFQKGSKTQTMNSGTGTATCTSAILAAYGYAGCSDTTTGLNGARPDTAIWTSETIDRNDTVGLGLQEDLGFARLGIDYSYARSNTKIGYNFGTTAFAATATASSAIAAIAGTALPDMTTVQNTIAVNLVKNIDKKTTIRAVYRYENMKITDWHYDSVLHNVMAAFDGNTLLMDSLPTKLPREYI